MKSNLQMRSCWLKSNLAVACHDLLTPNQVRRSGEISQLSREDQGSIPHLAERIKGLALYAIPNFAEADSSLAARLLSRYKTDWLNLFSDFQGDYTPIYPINSLPEAHKEKKGGGTKREEKRARIQRKLEIYSLAFKNSENCFSNPTRINSGC